MKSNEKLKNLLFPPKCVGCGEILGVGFAENRTEIFCPSCKEKYGREKLRLCMECNREMMLCGCMPEIMSAAGVTDYIKLFGYDAGAGTPGDRLVLYMKDKKNNEVFSFAANELSAIFLRYAENNGLNIENSLITYIPRRKNAVYEHGFDQAKELAGKVAENLGLCRSDLIRRTGFFGREQKKLGADERIRNVAGHFSINDKIAFTGKSILIIDDIVTTGAGMAECAKLLYAAGAENVIALSLARTL